MDRQTDPITSHTHRKQKSGKSTPPIWVPTPKTRVSTHTPTDRPGAIAANTDDRMIHPKIFKQLQKLSNHTFTLDVCANSKGDNALCSQYCSLEDSFLNKDLKGEFVWLNPPFKRTNEFLEAYFTQKRTYPDHVGACILLPCWRQFANIPELRQMIVFKQFTTEMHLFSQPGQGQSNKRDMAGVPWAVNVYYDPPRHSTFHAQAHESRQALVFKAKVGQQRAQLLLDTGTTDRSFINATTCRRLETPIQTPMPFEKRCEAHRIATSTAVDPTEFTESPLGTPELREDPGVLPHMLTPVTYGNGVQATPLGVASFTLQCQGFWTRMTCVVLDLIDKLDVVLGHEWCKDHQVIISYKDENVTFVYKAQSNILRFDDPDAQIRSSSSSLCSIRQATRFVQKQQRAFLVMVRRVADLPGGTRTLRRRPQKLTGQHHRSLSQRSHHKRLTHRRFRSF